MKRVVPTLVLAPDEFWRAGLLGILAGGRYRPMEVKGGWEAAASSGKSLPAIVILVPNGPIMSAAHATMIEVMAKRSKVVVLLADPCDADFIRKAVCAGAVACLPRSVSSVVLLQTLDLVIEGQAIIPASVVPAALGCAELEEEQASHADRGDSEKPTYNLSPREVDILRRLVHGDSNKQMSRQLNITETTVKVHVKAILRKLRLSNRTQAAIWGLDHLSDLATPSAVPHPSNRVVSEALLVPPKYTAHGEKADETPEIHTALNGRPWPDA